MAYAYLDTGAMYRAATWLALDTGVDPAERALIAKLIDEAEFGVSTDPKAPAFTVNGVDVTAAIREPRISAAVSKIATNLQVRKLMISRQRAIIDAARPGIVAEGRDITTVVAPDAQVRVLLLADAAARVARRQSELGDQVKVADVQDQVIRRDRDDATVAQFEAAAPGVAVIDSTELSLDQVIDRICALIAIAGVQVPAAGGQ